MSYQFNDEGKLERKPLMQEIIDTVEYDEKIRKELDENHRMAQQTVADERDVEQQLNKTRDNIKPEHYRRGELDMMMGWYYTQPWNEWRTSMMNIAERYMRRIKDNPLEDLEKAKEVIDRVIEKELERSKEDV